MLFFGKFFFVIYKKEIIKKKKKEQKKKIQHKMRNFPEKKDRRLGYHLKKAKIKITKRT